MTAEKFPVKIIDAVCQLHQQSKQGDTHMNMHIITSGGLSIVLFSGSVHFPGESIFMRRKRKPTPSGRFHSGGDNRTRFAFLPEGQKYRCCRRRDRRQATVHRTGTRFVKDGFPICIAPKPPLCKGRWAAERWFGGVDNPSVSCADSSLYTREPFLCRRQIAQHHRLSPVVSKCALRQPVSKTQNLRLKHCRSSFIS